MNNERYLVHHGILGQKWGVRRYQNEDGSLTAAGRARYNTNVSDAKVKSNKYLDDYKKALKTDPYSTRKSTLDKGYKYTYSKKRLSDEKIKEKLNTENKKSKRRIALEESYKIKGFSDDEAAILAYRRARVEKTLLIAGGITIAAAAGYIAYKHYDKSVDKVLKSGATLYNIGVNSDKNIDRAFYGATNKLDRMKYKGLLADNLAKKGTVYETTISTKKDLRIASEKSALKALQELATEDSSFKNDMENRMNHVLTWGMTDKQKNVIQKAKQALSSGSVDKNVYEAFNLMLTDHSSEVANRNNQQFYDKLLSKGYGAIQDINDKRLSNYGAINPAIVFGIDSSSTEKKVREIGAKEIKKNLMANTGLALGASSAAQLGATYVGIKLASDAGQTKRDNDIIKKYKKEHPNTKLSNTEILDSYYKY